VFDGTLPSATFVRSAFCSRRRLRSRPTTPPPRVLPATCLLAYLPTPFYSTWCGLLVAGTHVLPTTALRARVATAPVALSTTFHPHLSTPTVRVATFIAARFICAFHRPDCLVHLSPATPPAHAAAAHHACIFSARPKAAAAAGEQFANAYSRAGEQTYASARSNYQSAAAAISSFFMACVSQLTGAADVP